MLMNDTGIESGSKLGRWITRPIEHQPPGKLAPELGVGSRRQTKGRNFMAGGMATRCGAFGFCESFGLSQEGNVGVNDCESGIRLAVYKFSPRKTLSPGLSAPARLGARYRIRRGDV